MNTQNRQNETSSILDIQFDFQQIEHSPITQVNSYNMSNDKQYIIICTQKGIVIVINPLFSFKCYLWQNSPFWIYGKLKTNEQNKKNAIQQGENQQERMIGVKMGSLVQNKNQAAVIPNFTSKKFKQTHVYIFDYEMQCILHSIDFFLNIQQLWITKSQIYVSNKKRVIIYNYLNDLQTKNQKYYLDTYKSTKPNQTLRYFQTHCQDYEDPFTINQILQIKMQDCSCGKFYISSKNPHLLAYTQTVSFNNQKRKKIWIYNQMYDSKKSFQQNIIDQSPFQIAISQNAQYLAYTYNQGRKIKVHNLKENCLSCILYVSSTVRNILKMEFFNVKIQGKQALCLGMIRKTNVSTATMHIFRIQRKSPTQQIKSQYRRYFPLFEKVFIDYGISQSLINPGFFVSNNVLYIFSISGIVYEAIDFSRTGNREEKTFSLDDFQAKWFKQKE